MLAILFLLYCLFIYDVITFFSYRLLYLLFLFKIKLILFLLLFPFLFVEYNTYFSISTSLSVNSTLTLSPQTSIYIKLLKTAFQYNYYPPPLFFRSVLLCCQLNIATKLTKVTYYLFFRRSSLSQTVSAFRRILAAD